MAYRRTHEEVVRDEAYDRQYAWHEEKHTRWWNAKWYLDCVHRAEWKDEIYADDSDARKGFYGYILGTQEFAEDVRPKVVWIIEQMNYTHNQLIELINEKEKMEHRGWCHKAEEKQHEIDLKNNEIWGMQDAIKILRGEQELGAEPVFKFKDPYAPNVPDDMGNMGNMGCLIWCILGIIVLVLLLS